MGHENARACCEKVQKDGVRCANGNRLLRDSHLDDQDGETGDEASAYRRDRHGKQGADNPQDDPPARVRPDPVAVCKEYQNTESESQSVSPLPQES